MELRPGGQPGGETNFMIGAVMTVVGVWLFFDSVQFTTQHGGVLSLAISGGRGGLMEMTSMGILLVPLFAGIIALFFDVKKTWAWALTGLELLILGVEARLAVPAGHGDQGDASFSAHHPVGGRNRIGAARLRGGPQSWSRRLIC